MAKKTTPSFVTEIPLRTTSKDRFVLKKCFWVAKQQYNALLGECLKRLGRMRNDKRFKEALNLYKQEGHKMEAKAVFKQLAENYGYSEYALSPYTQQFNTKGNILSIGARISQQIAKRVFNAVKEYELRKRGKPRFKGYRGINSLESNSIDANLRLKNNVLHYKKGKEKLELPLLFNLEDPIHHHGLSNKIKYVRLIKRSFNGRTRYFAQLICEGKPWRNPKNEVKEAKVGLDIGPQTIAIVSPETKYASLQVFADELRPIIKKLRKLQRKLARQLRRKYLNGGLSIQ